MQKQFIKKIFIFVLAVVMTLTTAGCMKDLDEPFTKQSYYFDTICDVTIYSFEDGVVEVTGEESFRVEADDVINEAFSFMADCEKLLSRTVEGSDVDRINKARGEAVKVDPMTFEIIKKGIEFGELSEGVFDITVGKASVLWDFHESLDGQATSSIPNAKELTEAVKHIDYKGIVLDEENMTVRLEDPEMMLDLGGIAKGYIADLAAEKIRSMGVDSAIVNLGGNIEVVGGKPDGVGGDPVIDFSLGIRDPLSDSGELLGIYPGKDLTVVTSGTYERFIEVDGKKYHHILDPKTGYPTDTDVLQVSIIAGAGHSVDCDGLSTTCLALGTEKGIELIRRLDEAGTYGSIEAIFVTNDGEILYSKDDTLFQVN